VYRESAQRLSKLPVEWQSIFSYMFWYFMAASIQQMAVLVPATTSHISTLRKQYKWWSNSFGCVHIVINMCSTFLWFFLLWLCRPFPGHGLPFSFSSHYCVLLLCNFYWHWAVWWLPSALCHFTCSRLSRRFSYFRTSFQNSFLGFLWQSFLLNALLTMIT